MKVYVEKKNKADTKYIYTDLENIKLNSFGNKTIKEKFKEQESEIKFLKEQVRILTRVFKNIIEMVGGINDEEETHY